MQNDYVEKRLSCAPQIGLVDRYVSISSSSSKTEKYDLETEISFLKKDSSIEVSCVKPIYLVIPDNADVKTFIAKVSITGEGDIKVKDDYIGSEKVDQISTWFKAKEEKKDTPTEENQNNSKGKSIFFFFNLSLDE